MSPRSSEGPDAKAPRARTDQQRHEQLLEALGQLKSVIEEQLAAIHDRLEHVAEVVRENIEEIGVLRDAIDEEKEVLEWAAQNDKPIFRLTSMPADPAAADFAQKLNSVTPADLLPEQAPTTQGSLF
jgi:hypothetical protein